LTRWADLALVRNVSRDTTLHTDESRLYIRTGEEYAGHESVKHAMGEYARGTVHTNTIEGFFSIFKRGMKGVYRHCGEQHLQRYLTECDFRYNGRKITDQERADIALQGIGGKRLTYPGKKPARKPKRLSVRASRSVTSAPQSCAT
jgi:hypothetical protein